MLCYFLLYSIVICLCIYIYIFSFTPFSIVVYHRILNVVPCALQENLVTYPRRDLLKKLEQILALA